ncbi:MAG: iron-containing alcohol dehydrogenase, partial [Planctomycetota bacterium]|nr:iron-containing alcohol dehydrogenase [Planctomycetota bacterium]
FRIAILDPTLTLTQPRRVTALTGIDALAHTLESYVTKSRNPASMAFGREAWRLIGGNLRQVLQSPDDLEARGAVQLGACFAGLAIENSMLGAAHALANPLTANFGIPHGEAIGLMLPHVIRFNGVGYNQRYTELLESTAGMAGFPAAKSGADGLAAFVTELVALSDLPAQLSQREVAADRLPALAVEAAKQWTAHHNPCEAGEAEMLALYTSAF